MWSLITLAVATTLTFNWQSQTSNPLNAFTMYEDKLSEIITNPQALGVRFYFGLYDVNGMVGVPKIMAVGVDRTGSDIVAQNQNISKIYNSLLPCPDVCADESPLLHQEFLTPMGIIPQGNHVVPFNEAVKMTSRWQLSHTIRSVYITKAELVQMFAHYNSNALRMYLGKDGNGEQSAILVGVDGNGNDLTAQGIYNSSTALCLGDQTTCDINSPLYHN